MKPSTRTALAWGLVALLGGLLLVVVLRCEYPHARPYRPPPAGATLYRRLPLDLAAEQWWPGDPARNRRLGITEYTLEERREATMVTLEGVVRVIPSDWIVTGDVEGEKWPVKDLRFRATYKPILNGKVVEW